MELFECIKPNPYSMKNKSGYIGYGCLTNKRTKANIVSKRKCSRYIRKYGFDITETWSLDYAIASWLSDNVGGFFRKCGSFDDWADYDIYGNKCKPQEDLTPFYEAENARKESYLQHLEEYLSTTEDYTKFIDFVIPRLIYYIKHHYGYPGDFSSDEEWTEILKTMVEDLYKCDTKLFIKYFYHLWD